MIPLGYRAFLQASAKAMFLLVCCSGMAAASALSNLPLDDILAIASGTRPASAYLSEPVYQHDAIRTLGYRPLTTAQEETKIAATLGALLSAEDTSLHKYAAEALGYRGRVEFLPQLFAMMDCEPHLFSDFFLTPAMNQRERPPEELLRAGLRSSFEGARSCIINLIAEYKLTAMRKEIEKLLETDSSARVRGRAAAALRKLGATESAPALQRAIEKDPSNASALEALGVLGSDAQVPTLLAFLDSHNPGTRDWAVRALAEIKVKKEQPLVEAYLRILEKNPERPPLMAAAGLARFHDRRALPFLRKIIETKEREDPQADRICARAIANAGGPEAVALLNEMVVSGWRRRGGDVEEAMAKLGDPSSARIVWPLYEKNPMRSVVSGWCMTIGGYKQAIKVLAACADKELLESIRARAALATDYPEKDTLRRVVAQIEQRLAGQTAPQS